MNNISEVKPDEIQSLLTAAYAGRVNDIKNSIRLTKKALAISRAIEDTSLIGASLNLLSLFNMITGAYKHSISLAKEAIAQFLKINDEKGRADAEYNIGSVYYKTDNYHLGLVYLMNSLSVYRKLNDYHNQARTQKSIGAIYEFIGDQKNAIKAYENCIEAATKINDLNFISNAYNPLSGIYLNQHKLKKATELIEKSIELKTQTNDVRGLAFAFYGRGKIYIKTKHYKQAETDFLKALKIHTEAGERLGTGMAYHKLGTLYLQMGLLTKAEETIKTGLEYSDKNNIMMTKIKCNLLLYQLYKQNGDSIKALKYLELYLYHKERVINTQTLKVIENYELITKMEALESEARMEREKAEIMEKKERAEHVSRIKQDFLSTMSHEIRTPLNAVTTITALLKERSEPEEKKLLESLSFASNNLLLIINDILDFSKLESGKMRIDKHPAVFSKLLENIIKTYHSMADDKLLGLSLKLDDGLSVAYELDETKLAQILGNLISNGIKYTEQGNVHLEVEKLGSIADDDLVRFKITDTGSGIPESFHDQLFQSFSQPKSVTTRKQGGSGLGLAIVKRLVELHNSEITFSSMVDRGSVFQFDLKLKRSAEPAKVTQKVSDQLKDKVILLAEDNMINALVARKLLSNWGVTSVHAVNGVEAVEKSFSRVFDYILMDIHMPEMNGFDATAQIRSDGNPNSRTPIFALTADITAELQEEYTTYFDGFLRKPIEISKLYEALMVTA